MHLYPIVSIPLEAREDTEQLGSKPKFWVLRDGQRWLFKEARPNTGEDWAEKVAAEIACTLGINAAKVELAEYDGKIGCISCNFINVEAGEALVHGNEVMAWKVTGYDKVKIFRQADHTLENIQQAIRALSEFIDTEAVLTELAGYMVLDALIGNTDRHHENWGLRLHSPVAMQTRRLSAAPSCLPTSKWKSTSTKAAAAFFVTLSKPMAKTPCDWYSSQQERILHTSGLR